MAVACLDSERSAAAAPASKPNFVIIYIDDMGYSDIGPFGSTKNRTPQLDRMAREGMKLTSFYAAPVCSVSRAQVMTGCYGQRVSVQGVFFPAGKNGLNPKENTIAELLKKQGYATACIGKWHLGDQPEFLPTNHGFDYYYGIPYSNDMNRKSSKTGESVCPLLKNDKVFKLLDGEGQSHVTREYTEEAVKFIHENKERPFFVYLPHTAVHVPIYPGKEFQGKSMNGRYGDWVEELDWSAGAILQALRELKLDRKTLVIFTSDNGPWLSKGADGGQAVPLRGGKGGTFEGGVREPTIAWWPETIEAGTSSDIVAGNIDFLPTFVKLAGGNVPAKPKIDGRDFSDVLFGHAKESAHEAWYYYRGNSLKAVRSGPWKLALGPQSEGMGLKTTGADALSKELRLYNLDDEISERTDLAARNPEVVARLRKLADEMTADIGNGKPGPGVRPAGFVENPVTLYPTEAGKPRGKKSKTNSKPVGKPVPLDKLNVGDSIATASAPQVAGRPFTISCEVSTGNADGIILSHGGSAVGYVLYLKGGHVVFVIRDRGGMKRVESAEKISGKFSLKAELGKGGLMSLEIDGKVVGESKASGLLSKHPQEDFDIGFDAKNPVDEDAPKGKFDGKVTALKITAQ